MSDEPENKSIMENLLAGEDDAESDSAPLGLKEIIHRSFRLTPPRPKLVDDDEIVHRSFRLTRTNKRKATIYFSKEIYRNLEQTHRAIHTILKNRVDYKVSMSRVVDMAVKIMAREFELKGEQSLLLRQIIKNTRKE